MSNKYTSVYDWLKYIKANVVGINLRELRIIKHFGLPRPSFIMIEYAFQVRLDVIYMMLIKINI